MKNIIEYISESISNKSELIKAIRLSKVGDTIDYLYGVTETRNGSYKIDIILSLFKRPDGKLMTISVPQFDDFDLIEYVYKKEGFGKLKHIGNGALLSEDQVIELIEILPKYFTDYINKYKRIRIKALSFSMNSISMFYDRLKN